MTDRYERIREEMSMTAETSNARGEVEYEYEVWQHGVLQAGGRETDYASAQSEASHYAAVYTPDGPVEVRIYEKRLLIADKVERDWLAPALDALAEWRFDAITKENRNDCPLRTHPFRAGDGRRAMTDNVKLPPLPEGNVAHLIAAQAAEIEALRAASPLREQEE